MKLEIACYQKSLVYIRLRVFYSKKYLCQNNLDSPHISDKASEVIDKEQGPQYQYWQYEQKTPETSRGLRLSEARLYHWGHPSAPHLVFY